MPTFWGRMGPGSGSSPTLMGNSIYKGIPDFVTITDGY